MKQLNKRTLSKWREYSFMFKSICSWIDPNVAATNIIKNWSRIRFYLSEGNRRRKPSKLYA